MAQIVALFLFLVLLLSGCGDMRGASNPYSMGPKNHTSPWLPPEKMKIDPLDVEDLSYLMNKAPLSLAETVDISLMNNPETKKMWAEARVSASEYGQSQEKYYLLTDLQGNYSRARTPFFAFTDLDIFYETMYGAGLTMNYTIFDFGQRRNTSQKALQALMRADFLFNRALQSTMKTVMADYYTYLYTKECVRAAEQDVFNAQTVLDSVLEKFRTGVADVSDKVQATTQLLKEKLKLVQDRQFLADAYATLLDDMGVPANFELAFESYPEEVRLFYPPSMDCLLSVATKRRPDLLASSANVRSKEANLKLAKSERYPVITGEFDISTNGTNLGLSSFYMYNAQVNLKMPIFRGFYLENGIKKALAGLEEAKALHKQKELAVVSEIAATRSEVINAKEALVYAKDYVDAADEDFKVNLMRYKVGTGTIVELINAQTSVSDANRQLIGTERAWYTSLSSLAYYAGTLNAQEEDFGTLEKNRLEPRVEETASIVGE